MLDSTSYLKEIEDNAKLTEKHLQIIRQQTADTEQRRILIKAELIQLVFKQRSELGAYGDRGNRYLFRI